MDEIANEPDDVACGRINEWDGLRGGWGGDRRDAEWPGAPVPVPLAPPASCHQEIRNAADEEGRGGKRSDEDGSHNPRAHGQVCNGQLRKLF